MHLALGDKGEALRWLRRAFEERAHSMVFLRMDRQLKPLHGEPETASRDSVNERGDAARQLVPDPAAEVHAVVKGRGGQPQLVQRAPHPGVLGAALTLLLPTSRENTCAPSGVSLGVRFGIGAPGPALTERALALTETRPVARC